MQINYALLYERKSGLTTRTELGEPGRHLFVLYQHSPVEGVRGTPPFLVHSQAITLGIYAEASSKSRFASPATSAAGSLRLVGLVMWPGFSFFLILFFNEKGNYL